MGKAKHRTLAQHHILLSQARIRLKSKEAQNQVFLFENREAAMQLQKDLLTTHVAANVATNAAPAGCA